MDYLLKFFTGQVRYNRLVFSGGGIKGICFCGVLLELDQRGILYDTEKKLKIDSICGVSAGSIIAALFAVGYTPNEIKDIMFSINLEKISNDGNSYIGETENIIEGWGTCQGNYIQELLGNLIKEKTGNYNYTFTDLYKEKGIELVILATNISDKKVDYFYHGHSNEIYSNTPIIQAVRMSMSIPGIFEPYHFNESLYVDGGVLDNYPLYVFDGKSPDDPDARLNLCKPNMSVIGVRIMTPDRVQDYNSIEDESINSLYGYINAIVNTILIDNERKNMTPSYWERSIIVITPNYPISKFTLTTEEKDELINAGKQYTAKFFDKK